ncbi:wax ester/triacylglycerol synthase domain-containing protein [Actinoplanes sp. NPDC049599]|uniref:wax ester/triacylglycerol synthase domain-containing protein n=1 Tax=Actinoplanes sp. NPDC049599 TaxID=3363903 RepID=UPI00379BC618
MGVDRASNSDLAFLAMDGGKRPLQFAAVLLLDRPLDPGVAERFLAGRTAAVPRLRQKLVRTPPGCGRPIWVDDTAYDIRRQLTRISCAPPGDEQALLDAALALLATPLPRDRPLWRAALVDGRAGGAGAVVLVLHHVLTDGLGGLALLARLLDPRDEPSAVAEPRRPPAVPRLAADAIRGRLLAVRRLPRTWRLLRASMTAGGGLLPTRAAPCSLLRPTGPRHQVVAAHADLRRLRAAAHAHGGTVNAALVAAVTGALHRLLTTRGERLERLAVVLPVAGRSTTTADRLGNEVSPLLIDVPVTGTLGDRISRIAGTVRQRRDLATGPPPIGLLGPLFRAAAALGGYHWFMNRQRRVHTLVSYVRGPEQPVRLAGATVDAVVPISIGESGNISISFLALSYAGTLTVTAVADPDRCLDLAVLSAALRAELDAVVSSTPPPDRSEGLVPR